jgi:hypothetical protein
MFVGAGTKGRERKFGTLKGERDGEKERLDLVDVPNLP